MLYGSLLRRSGLDVLLDVRVSGKPGCDCAAAKSQKNARNLTISGVFYGARGGS